MSDFSDVLNLADSHVGHIVGLWPENFETRNGIVHSLNVGQQWLLEKFMAEADRIGRLEHKPKAVVINGDAIDGTQTKQRALEAVSVDTPDQSKAAQRLYTEFLERAGLWGKVPVYMIAGTEYHDGLSGAAVEGLAEGLGCQIYEGRGSGRFAKEVLDLEVYPGRVINFQHGIGVSTGLYRATAPDQEGIWSALAGREGKLPKAEVLVRSHAHYYVHIEHESKHILISPCWQLQTRYMRRRSAYRMLPSIGTVTVRCYEKVEEGQDAWQIIKQLYPLPPYSPTVLTSLTGVS